MKSPDHFKYDVRIRARALKSGMLDKKEIDGRLAALPDLEDDAAIVDLQQPALTAEAAEPEPTPEPTPEPASPPAAFSPPPAPEPAPAPPVVHEPPPAPPSPPAAAHEAAPAPEPAAPPAAAPNDEPAVEDVDDDWGAGS